MGIMVYSLRIMGNAGFISSTVAAARSVLLLHHSVMGAASRRKPSSLEMVFYGLGFRV